MLGRVIRAVTVLLSLSLAAGVVAFLWFQKWTDSPLSVTTADDGKGLIVVLDDGEGLGSLSRRLSNEGTLDHPQALNLLGRISGADAQLRPGEYEILSGTTPRELLKRLIAGDTVRYLLTLPEGITLAQGLDLIQEADGVSATLTGVDDPQLRALVTPYEIPEGLFLPESYQYERGVTDLELLGSARRLLEEILQTAWAERDPSVPLDSPYDLLTLASIIEKETGVASERPEIAGVFARRLQRGMRLQTDPTVIYGLGEDYEGDLKRSHLRDERNPYNSYRHHGLPPSPIALPGRGAIEAAARPALGDALYFVARGDGSHTFSATLQEHEEAVARYQLQRRSDYRSSPPP
ncbi:MAG: endolytic transglycosylase MltG [Pseudomonadota bacterium]